MSKVNAFEYLLSKLILWYSDLKGISTVEEFNSDNDFSKLKVLKLLFFVSASDTILLDTFNKFYAMPYGHVESEIYSSINKSEISNFKINSSRTTILSKSYEELDGNINSTLDPSVKDVIDHAIEELRKVNEKIVTYSAIQLVDLSHMWFSWSSVYESAKRHGLSSLHIPHSLIKEEQKIYHLSSE